MITSQFAVKHNDKDVYVYDLTNRKGHSVSVTNYGATIISIRMPDKNDVIEDVALGFDTVAEQRFNRVGFLLE